MRWRALWFVACCACGNDPAPSRCRDKGFCPDPDAYLTDAPFCELVPQTNCGVGEKCTWIVDTFSPYSGHVGCTGAGYASSGQACMFDFGLVGAFDECAGGLVCGDVYGAPSTCQAICDPRAIPDGCAPPSTCTTMNNVFIRGGQIIAGICR